MNVLLPALLAACCAAAPPAELPPITALAFAPDGRSLVAGSQNGVEVRSWPGLTVERRIETGLAQVHDLAFSPDGTRLALAGGAPAESGGAEVVRWPGGERVYAASDHSDVAYAVAWSDDGMLLATASLDDTVAIRQATGGEVLDWLEGHSGGVKAVTFLTADSLLVTGGLDQTLRTWDISALKELGAKHRAPNDLKPNDSGTTLRAPTDGAPGDPGVNDRALKLRALSDERTNRRAPIVRAQTESEAELRARGNDPAELRARMVRALTNHTGAVHDLATRPGDNRPALPLVASVSEDRTIRLWQPTIGRMVRFARLKDTVPLAVRWTVDGRRLVVVCTDGRVRVIDPDTASVVNEIEALDGWAYSLVVHPDGKEIAVGGERVQVVRVRLPD